MTTRNRTLRVLHVEDSHWDAALLSRHLTRGGYELVTDRVETAEAMKSAVESRDWDVILCDYAMPQFDALEALALTKARNPDLPFIIVSGAIGETEAVEAMRAGAQDYVSKDSLGRLIPAIERELEEAEDRRARRAAETQSRLQSAALEATQNAMLITDAKGNIVWVNPAFSRHTGYSFDEVRGENPRLLKSGKQDEAFYREMWGTILAGKVWSGDLIDRCKDGTLKHHHQTINPILDAKGAITHFVSVQRDLTELERAFSEIQAKSNELAAMGQQLWQASKLATMGELAASIAHELNNPLATLALQTEDLLQHSPEDSDLRASLESIGQEIDRMTNLVGNLLQFSRRNHRHLSSVDAREELTNSLGFVHYYLRNRNIKVRCEFAASVPMLHVDYELVRQLFINLLTNAADAMSQGGTLTVRVSPTVLRGAEAVEIEFADTGMGIPAEDLERVWEPFFTTKPEGEGTGLGLAICRRIVGEHKGAIDIESEPGKGTAVRVVFPVVEREQPELQ